VVIVQRSGAGMVSAAVHRVRASAEGIAVVLYSPSAVGREAACERALRELEAEVAQQRQYESSSEAPNALVASGWP